MTERLQVVASAATVARRREADLVVVWPEGGSSDFPASWSDLFEGGEVSWLSIQGIIGLSVAQYFASLPLHAAPALPLGPFPGGQYSPASAACSVHRTLSADDFSRVESQWERFGGEEVLCVATAASLVPDPRQAHWFHPHLKPSPQ